jgi:UDP:flavonoid glycosyltransferase YjiC (YdhE family)
MRLAFFQVKRKPSEILLAEAFAKSGVDVVMLDTFQDRCECDAYCVVGVKHGAVIRQLTSENLPYIFWDKGYNRLWSEWWRFAYCAYQPWRAITENRYPTDRMLRQGWESFSPWRRLNDGYILFAATSPKSHVYHGLPTVRNYAEQTIMAIRKYTDRPILYRPRVSPGAGGDFNIPGCRMSPLGSFDDDLEGAAVVLTHSSSACFDALMSGVPCVVLGDGVTRGICSTTVADIEAPRRATHAERRAMLSGMAYHQWSLTEIREGKLWPVLRSIMRSTTSETT